MPAVSATGVNPTIFQKAKCVLVARLNCCQSSYGSVSVAGVARLQGVNIKIRLYIAFVMLSKRVTELLPVQLRGSVTFG